MCAMNALSSKRVHLAEARSWVACCALCLRFSIFFLFSYGEMDESIHDFHACLGGSLVYLMH